jgi:hypothetical protein
MPRSPALFDVAVRGSSFEQVLVLVDGIRMSDAQTGHFDLNLAVPLDQVDRIEILRGPASTLHGADADAYPLAGVRLGVAGFIRSADHLIDWAKPASTPKAPWQTRNVEDARFHGVETEAGIDELLGVRWTLRGSWLSVRSSEAEGFTSKYALRPLTESVSLVAERGLGRGVHATLRAEYDRPPRQSRLPAPGCARGVPAGATALLRRPAKCLGRNVLRHHGIRSAWPRAVCRDRVARVTDALVAAARAFTIPTLKGKEHEGEIIALLEGFHRDPDGALGN